MRTAVALATALALSPFAALAADAPPQGAPPPGANQSAGPKGPPAGAKPPEQKPLSAAEVDKALYGIGLAISRSLEVFDLSPAELETVLRGLRDAQAGKPKAKLDTALQQQVDRLARARMPRAQAKATARDREQSVAYLARTSKEKGARKTPSGAIVITEKEGTGPSPTPADKVKVNYTGTLAATSGRVFDTTAQRGPAEFALGGVIKCWTEAIPTMKVGGKAKIVCPSDIAYGPAGNPGGGIPPNAVLTFEVELLEILK